ATDMGGQCRAALSLHSVLGLFLALLLGEFRHLARSPVSQPRAAQQARGDVLIRWRQLDAHRASRTGFQEFDLDGSDAAAHLEHGSAFDALRLQKVHDLARSSIKAPAAVAARLGTCAALAEDPFVTLRRAAVGHESDLPATGRGEGSMGLPSHYF